LFDSDIEKLMTKRLSKNSSLQNKLTCKTRNIDRTKIQKWKKKKMYNFKRTCQNWRLSVI